MATTQTPNMGLNLPVPGQEPGPTYATDNNSAFTIIDGHNHSPGYGEQITPAGLNINSDLAFQNTNAYQLRSVRYINNSAALATASDLNCTYVSGGNLYYNNASGTAVQITSGSSVNAGAGSITGLPSGTASVTYSSTTYVFQSATSTPATIDVGSVIIRNTTASAKGVTLSPINALSANYALVLPTIPASTSFLSIDTSGNIAAYSPVVGGIGTTQLADNAVTTVKITDAAVTRPKLVAVGQQISSTCGFFAPTTSFTDVTNLSVTITTTGRPVMVILQSDGSASLSFLQASGGGTLDLALFRGASQISDWHFGSAVNCPTLYLDPVAAGTYTYKVQAKASSGGAVDQMVLVAYEL